MQRIFATAGASSVGLRTLTGALFAGLFLLLAAAATQATPITPTRDDEVIEVLPATSGNRSEERRARKLLEARPRDPELAVAVAKRYLDQAHELGDPRFAGLALAAIAPWTDDATTPDDVLMMKATLQQYLHEFDASVRTLVLLARPTTQGRPQAWLTLATVRRVQGHYAESDKACRQVADSGAALHSSACLAENAALRGEVDAARNTLGSLLSQPGLPVATQSWLLTTVAELEQRDGHPAAADAAFRAVLQLEPDPYAMVDYADFLIEQHRPLEALKLLKDQTRTDVVLLRLAIAGTQAKAAGAARDVAEMRERIALANERPGRAQVSRPRAGDVRAGGRACTGARARPGARQRRAAARAARPAGAGQGRARERRDRRAGRGATAAQEHRAA